MKYMDIYFYKYVQSVQFSRSVVSDSLQPHESQNTSTLHYIYIYIYVCVMAGKRWLYIYIYRASLVAQLVQNLPAMLETWFQSLGQEDPLEKGMATHFSILA